MKMVTDSRNNQVLKKITKQIYDRRPMMPVNQRTHYRIERANGGLLCDLWFLTRGCVHDACGGCTMCNYGKGGKVIQQEAILHELGHIMEKLPWEFEDFLLTPSGSMLDEREVPDEMKKELKVILKNVKAKRFIVETRADTISEQSLEFLKDIMPMAEKYVEIGYESGNNWILRNCINKGIDAEAFEKAVGLVHKAGAKVTANIAIGIPFLSERASIQESIFSVKKAFIQGADSVVLFPYHIKHGTLLEVMYQNGWYQSVSLWALVEVLTQLSVELLDRIQISWYKDYFGEKQSNIFVSPTTCEKCRKDVLYLLDRFREEPCEVHLNELIGYDCECKKVWKKALQMQDDNIEFERVEKIYRMLAAKYEIEDMILEEELLFMKKTIQGEENADKC